MRFFLACFALVSSVLNGYAESDTTKLTISVQSLNAKPVERASVIVNFIDGRSIVKLGKKITKHWEVRTNQEGLAKIPSIPQGKVRIQIIAKGFQTFGATYDVDQEEKLIPITLNPPQQQYSAHQ